MQQIFPTIHGYDEPSFSPLYQKLQNTPCSKPTEIWINTLKGFPGQSHTEKIFVAVEPDSISHFNTFLLKNSTQFKHIITYEECLLKKLPNTVLFEFGTTWIHDYSFPQKVFGVSMVYGFKKMAEGHRFRHRLWKIREEISIPKYFYISTHGGGGLFWELRKKRLSQKYPLLGNQKSILFSTQFHLAIENAQDAYFFTEKLLDCFVTKTVPIYWGATQIDKYFNTKGMIIVENEREAVSKLNQLTPDLYDSMQSAIEDNHDRAQPFITDYPSRLFPLLKTMLQSLLTLENYK